jgi:transaldolase
MSLDGFVAGPNEDFQHLFAWMASGDTDYTLVKGFLTFTPGLQLNKYNKSLTYWNKWCTLSVERSREESFTPFTRVQEIYEALAMTDERTVADLLRPTYERTKGQDGFVSIEVSPYLAHDTEGTLSEVRRFWETIDRPNLMVKIPSTPAGVPAIRQALAEGININITLIFSIENYRQVAEAYLSALEERSAKGQDISRIASVASFFVSRVDVLVDNLLEDKMKSVGSSAQQQQLKALEGKAAIANARLAYQEFKRLFSGPRFAALKQQGARVQRPLWASTGTKNPAYSDVLYVEELIGPDTVNTMPLKTLERYHDHGRVRFSIEDQLLEAKTQLAALEDSGIHYDQVTRQLQEEGVQKFIDSFHTLFECIDNKRKVLQQERGV